MSDLQGSDLHDKVVVITGAARGQGRAEALACARAGATVVVTGHEPDPIMALAAEIDGHGFELDVSDDAQWSSVVAAIGEAFGRVDGLVNNAGVYSSETLLDGSVETTRRVWDVNQLGVYLGMRHVAPLMPSGSSIVNISSIGGMRGYPAFAYVASKWAVRGMTKSAARELAPRGIRVNSVHPGPVDTPMIADTPPDRLAALEAGTPLGRIGTVGDIVGPVLFLLGPDSAYMTGAELTVDGGLIV